MASLSSSAIFAYDYCAFDLASDLPESFAAIRDARPALPDWLAGTLFNKSKEALGLWFFCHGPRLFLVAPAGFAELNRTCLRALRRLDNGNRESEFFPPSPEDTADSIAGTG